MPRRLARIGVVSAATVLVVSALGAGIASAANTPSPTNNTSAATVSAALAAPCPQLTGPTKPGTCPTGPTGALQKQVNFLTTTVNYYKKTASKFSSGAVGPANAIDYGLESLWEEGIDGNGVTVAVMEEWNEPATSDSALKKMSTTDHLPTLTSLGLLTTLYPTGPLPTTKTITAITDHGKYKTANLQTTTGTKSLCPEGMIKLGSYGSCSAWEGELELDIEAVHMFAPYAHIVIAATPADSQITDSSAFNVAAPELIHAVAEIAANHLANVISISDGTGETTYAGLATLSAQNVSELTAAAAGVPVLVATGDCGVIQNLSSANGQCSTGSTTPETAAWDDSPWITAVGGSVEHITKGVKTGTDTGWPTSGAGYSAVYPRPAYQNAVADGAPMRSVPDLVMDSSEGTSEAAPSFNGVLALATQLNGGKDLGPIQTALYKIGPEGAAAGIVDVTTGSDATSKIAGFHAGPGFDVDTGWGTVTAAKFVFSLDQETNALSTEQSARAQAASDVRALEQVQLTPRGSETTVLGKTFIPKHPVTLSVTGTVVTTLTVTALGDVTYTLTPAALGLAAGTHTVTLSSLLVTETGTFSDPQSAGTPSPPPPASSSQRLLLMPTKLTGVTPETDTYVLGQGFSPGASVKLSVTGTLVTTLTGGQGSTKGVPGDVTWMITPSALKLAAGTHTVTLTSTSVTETGQFVYEHGASDKGADLGGQTLAGATLAGATLQTATLSLANLGGANLTDADCHGANFSGANLTGTNLSEADCEGANFTGANLPGADLTGTTTATATVSKDATTATVTASEAVAPYTHQHTAVFGVTVKTHVGEAVPTGEQATIHVGAASCTATLSAGSGTCQIPAGSLPPAGPYAVSASYGGDADLTGSTSTNVVTFTVTRAAPAFTITVTGAPSTTTIAYGATATLSETGIPTTATGSVTFETSSGTTSCTATLATATTCTTGVLAVGSYSTIDGSYTPGPGTTDYTGATSTNAVTLTVTRATPSITIKVTGVTAASIPYGSTATLSEAGVPATATGTVTFKSGTTALCTATLATAMSCTTSAALAAGTYPTIEGSFTPGIGTPNYFSATSTNSVTLLVSKKAPTFTITITGSTAATIVFGSKVTLAVTGLPTTGTVSYKSGTTALCTATLATATSCTTATTLPAGAYAKIKGFFTPGSGTTNYAGSTSMDAVTLTVTAKAPAFTITVTGSTAATLTFGAGATLAASGLPTSGTVTFTSGTTTLCTATLATATSCTTAATLPAATYSAIKGDFTPAPGTTNYTGAISTNAVTLTVAKATPSFTITVTGSTSAAILYGSTVTIAESGLPATASGIVTFKSGTTVLCAATLAIATTCATSATLPAATYSAIKGSFTPGGVTPNYTGATSTGAVTLTVAKATPSFTITVTGSTSASVAHGTKATLAETGLPTTGTVTFKSGSATLCTATLPATSCTTASTLPIGTYSKATGYFTPAPSTKDYTSATSTNTVTLAVTGKAPAFTSKSTADFVVLQKGAFTITTMATPTATVTESGKLPAGLHFSAIGGGKATISGTPGPFTQGTYTVTLKATNGIAPAGTQQLTVVVGIAPAIVTPSSTSFVVGQHGTFVVRATGYPDPSLTRAGTLPTGLTFTTHGNGTATISGSPAAGTGGKYHLTLTATNPFGTAVLALTLVVNQAAAITSAATTTFTVGTSKTATITATGYPAPSIVISGALPKGLTFKTEGNGKATVSGKPATGTGGVYKLTVTASNGVGAKATQSFTLTVNQPAVFTSHPTAIFAPKRSNTFTITTSGYPSATITETGTLPAGVGFMTNGNGTATISGKPTTSAKTTYKLTLRATNGALWVATQTFTLTVG